MALPSAYWILSFYLLLLMCDHGCGARDVAKQEHWNHANGVKVDEAGQHLNQEEMNQPYIAGYRNRQANYIASYGTREDVKDNYVAQYGTKKALKDSGMEYKEHHGQQVEVANQKEIDQPYIAAYQKRQTNYITSYGTKKDVKDNYVAQYGTKKALKDSEMKNKEHGHQQVEVANQNERNQPYIAAYRNTEHGQQVGVANKQEIEYQPYIAAYRKRQANYITSYGSREDVKDNYIAQYNTKETLKDSEMKNKEHGHQQVEVANQKERNQPYIAGYRNTQHGQQVVVANKQEIEYQPYIAAYRKRQANYITSYGSREDVKDNYVAQYNTKETLKDSEMKNKEHGHQQVEVANQKERNQPYIAGYSNTQHGQQVEVANKQEIDQPYKAGYKNKQANYITSYGNREDVKDNYITQYGTKEALKDSEIENKEHCGQQVVENQKEMNQQPYIAGYRNREANYKTGYGGGGDAKDSYITSYTRKSQNSYIAAYRNTQDLHENQMAEKASSSHMDHSEAFKSGFFAIDDLYVGRAMAVHFPIQEFPHFLPREEADSIPFSLPQLPNVLQLFSIPTDSPNAKAMKDTLQQCESLPIKGEIKLCATSLESMVDFVNNIMGSRTNLNVLTTTTHPTMPTALTQNYTVLRISAEIYAPKWVACHPLPYPYKVFYCHFIERSKIFKVSLGGENGQKVEAVAVCHMDTSDWDPNHILFSQLGIKPGSSSPICHFLPVYHLVWVPSPTTASI